MPDSAPKPLPETLLTLLQGDPPDTVVTRFLVPGLEYQLWLDGHPVRIPADRNGEPRFYGELIRVEQLRRRLGLVGTTGWNYVRRMTLFIGLDYDAKDHDAGHVEEVLNAVIEAARRLGYAWVRRSKGGRGFHVFVVLSVPLRAMTGEEHQRNARAIVDRMCQDADFDFRKHLDCSGVVCFFWAPREELSANAFEVLVEPTCSTPAIEVAAAEEAEPLDWPKGELTDQHKQDIETMRAAGFAANWDGERLLTHSKAFEVLYRDGSRPGRYASKSPGRKPTEPNAFAYPTCDGGWCVTRFNITPEAETEGWYPNAQGFATARILPLDDDLVATAAPEPDPPAEEKQDKKDSQKKPTRLLLDIAREHELCCTMERVPIVVVDRKGKRQTYILPDHEFEGLLAKQLFQRQGIIAKGAEITNAMRLVEALCLDGPRRPVFTRLGYHDGVVYFDLGDDTLRVVKITRDGWTIESNCSILFHRSPNVSAMPEPARGGKLAELRELLHIKDHEWPVIAAFMLQCLNPFGPYALLVLLGQSGSTKSTIARLLQGAIDSTFDHKRNREELFEPPKSTEDLMVLALHSWLLSFDNIGKINDRLAEGFCRLATGGAYVARKLYTNSGLSKMTAQQPVILTMVDDIIDAEDLRSRCLFIGLELLDPDKLIGEETLRQQYELLRPRLMGALFDCVSCALRNFETTKPLPGNRLADMTRWVVAAEPATGFPSGTLARALTANRRDSAEEALGNPLADGIRKLAAQNVRLKPMEICKRLAAMEISDVPEPESLGRKLKAMATELATVGVLVKKDGRYWIIRSIGETNEQDTATD
jgi:hypothetical protein